MKKTFLIILSIALFNPPGFTQTITLDQGFEELKIGITAEEVEAYIGFSGKIISRQEYEDTQSLPDETNLIPVFRLDFDQCILYNHIMPVPVTRVFLKNNRVIGITVSSLPSFSRPICLDTQTMEGLSFWASRDKMIQVYGENYRQVTGPDEITYYYFDEENIGFGLLNNEVRIIEVF